MKKELILPTRIVQSIHVLRGQKVIFDSEIAELYGVAKKVLNQAVKRNQARFPADFMFRLTAVEASQLRRSQFVTLKRGENLKYRPFAFTEQGVAMLSSILRSERAVKVNIAIMRAFVKFREALDANRELARKFAQLDSHLGKHDEEIAAIIDAIRQLMVPPEKPRREIGFHVREKAPRYRAANRR
jgi:phage regulator Rha-like protein